MYFPMRKCQASTHFKLDEAYFYTPCGEDDPNGLEMKFNDIPADQIMEPKVSFEDYLMALMSF